MCTQNEKMNTTLQKIASKPFLNNSYLWCISVKHHKKRAQKLDSSKPSILVVAGDRFELPTFGL